jgi:PAS domain S-box-containing protein
MLSPISSMSSRHSFVSGANDALLRWLPLAFEHAPDDILFVDDAGCILAANGEAVRLTGYRLEELVGARVDMLVPSRLAPAHAAHREQYSRAPRTRYMGAGRRLQLRRRDGSEVHVEIGLGPVAHGTARAFICAIRDVSHVREVEQTLRRRTTELERALSEIQQQAVELGRLRDVALATAEARSRFLSTVSHEIRTPLNGLTGVLDLLGDIELTPTQRELVSMGKVSAEWRLALVNDVLDLSKLEASRVTLEELDFDLTALVDEIVRILGVIASARGVRLTARFDPCQSFLLRGDARRLRQVLVNLVGNAIKFTPDGEVAVAVALRAETDDRADVELRVVDTGCGMDESTQSRLSYRTHRVPPRRPRAERDSASRSAVSVWS